MNGGIEYGRRGSMHAGFTARVCITAFLNGAAAEQSRNNDWELKKCILKKKRKKKKRQGCVKKKKKEKKDQEWKSKEQTWNAV